MAILPADQRSQIMLLLTLAALAGGRFLSTQKHPPAPRQVTPATAGSPNPPRTLPSASPGVQTPLGDTAGALLLAEFSIGTFVKSAGPPPGSRPAAAGAPRARS